MTLDEFKTWLRRDWIDLDSPKARKLALGLLCRLGIPTRNMKPETTYHWDGRSVAIKGVDTDSIFHEAGHWLNANPKARLLPEYGLGPGPSGGPTRNLPSAKTMLRGAVSIGCEERASLLGIMLTAAAGVEFLSILAHHDWAWFKFENAYSPVTPLTDRAPAPFQPSLLTFRFYGGLESFKWSLQSLRRKHTSLGLRETFEAFERLSECEGMTETELLGKSVLS